MRKISIICEKNEKSNTYEIKTIVIFKENEKPEIIEFKGVEDLIPVAAFAEEKGFSVLNDKEVVKTCVKAGLIDVIRKNDEKKMSELKAEIMKRKLYK